MMIQEDRVSGHKKEPDMIYQNIMSGSYRD